MYEHYIREPYRLFFPLGTILLLAGVLLWLPVVFLEELYPVVLHRYLVLNGFTACFVGGFLMTAVPKFSKTDSASRGEVCAFLAATVLGAIAALLLDERWIFLFSSAQALVLLAFIFKRIHKRKENPPYSFIFIFVGLFLWGLSGVMSFFFDSEGFKYLHYEGAIACLILGVGSRLIPGILGHVEIVAFQRRSYERPVALIKTIPLHFLVLIATFLGSYFLGDRGLIVRAVVVTIIGLSYWRLWRLPKTRTALTHCLWFCAWLIVLSFVVMGLWPEAHVHIGHSFFINGIVLLSLLIATRVLVSHGKQDSKLENKKTLYFVTLFVVLSSLTRVAAYIIPDSYLGHLSYASFTLVIGIVIWAFSYLKLFSKT